MLVEREDGCPTRRDRRLSGDEMRQKHPKLADSMKRHCFGPFGPLKCSRSPQVRSVDKSGALPVHGTQTWIGAQDVG